MDDKEVDNEIKEEEIAEASALLEGIGLFDRNNRPEKLLWLHTKLLQTHDSDVACTYCMYMLYIPLYCTLGLYTCASLFPIIHVIDHAVLFG